MTCWNVDFLRPSSSRPITTATKSALIILNQPFSSDILRRLWSATQWHCCADGGANRLHDVLTDSRRACTKGAREEYIPDLVKGDLDSLRDDVRAFYASHGVPIIRDYDQDSTDLMKCVEALEEKENQEGSEQYDLIVLGGLSGRLDQTIHTLSYLHKLRKRRHRVFVVTDESVGWVLDSGEHHIKIDHCLIGQTCGLLPIGVDCTIISTRGLRWNLTDNPSSFDGLVSTSNHLVPGEDTVWVKTTKPIWWTAEVRKLR